MNQPLSSRRANVNLDNVMKVINGMYAVVQVGTGARARIPGVEVCGKTGTAQLASNDLLKNTAVGTQMKDKARLVGFAPRTNPEIVVVALFEGGEHGNLAAPIVRDVIKAHFDKQLRRNPPQVLARVPQPPPAVDTAISEPSPSEETDR
jgi:penicillin-binding protein 2